MTTTSYEDWRKAAEQISIRNQLFINGRFCDAASGKSFDCISPRDNKVIATIAEGDAEDIDRAVQAARQAFEAEIWAGLPPRERGVILQRLAGLMMENIDELALLETLDMGKPITASLTVDVPAAANCIKWYGEVIDKIYDEIAPTDKGSLGLISREPLGVVAAVVPWNFPLLMACWKLGPALAAGNSVVLKPAEQSPLTALRLAELAIEAGLPDGVLNVVPGYGETAGQALGLHNDVAALAFTGSTTVGKLFLQYSGQSNMKKVALECGGKSPNVVMGDCGDLEAAASGCASGIFYNQGEVCTAGSRLIVDARIKDELLEKIIPHAKNFLPGDPLDPATTMGAMVDRHHMENVTGYIDKGTSEGATLRFGGKQTYVENQGCYIEPTIFDNVTEEMTIFREEIFGPVLSVIEYSDEQEALRIANDTVYGLGAAIWTDNLSKAHRAARAIKSGSVWVNCYGDGDMTVPFGGFKQSGFGRDKSVHALEKYTDLKTTWINLA